MAIEWDETVETKRRVRMLVGGRGSPSAPAAAVWAPGFRDATIDDLRRACEAAGLVVETQERMDADLEDRTQLRKAYQQVCDVHDACLAEMMDPVTKLRPLSVLGGIRTLKERVRQARADYREHDAALEAATERAEKAEAELQKASEAAIVAGWDGVQNPKTLWGFVARQAEDLAAARARIAELEGANAILTAPEDVVDAELRSMGVEPDALAERSEKFLDGVRAELRLATDEEVPATLARMLGEVGA